MEMDVEFQSMFEKMLPSKRETRRLSVTEARKLLLAQEAEKLIDKNKIHLGKFSLPSALLYQLPLARYQGDISRDRERNMIAQEMYEQSHRRLNEEQFREAVKAIRARKERERREAEAAKHGTDPQLNPVSTGTR